MKASTCQIYVGGKLILQAKNVVYAGKKVSFSGLTFVGSVGKVLQPEQAEAVLAMLTNEGVKELEVRLSL